jgi:hypothetical protein
VEPVAGIPHGGFYEGGRAQEANSFKARPYPPKIMLEELRRRNYSEATIRHYLRFVERFAPLFGKLPDKLGPDRLRTYQSSLSAQAAETGPGDR